MKELLLNPFRLNGVKIQGGNIMEKLRIGALRILMIAAALLALVFSGCAHAYLVKVDSINTRQIPEGKNYIIAAGNKNTDSNDLQFEEYSSYLSTALGSLGYKQVDQPGDADIEIFLSYGVGDPQKHQYAYTQPVWGQTGTQTSTYATVNNINGTKVVNSYTDTEPDYGVVGYTTQVGEYTTYEKYVVIDAYDLKTQTADGKLKHLWKTSISCVSKTQQLRKVFPILIAGAWPYLGGNTGEEITVTVPVDSDEVEKLTHPQPQPAK